MFDNFVQNIFVPLDSNNFMDQKNILFSTTSWRDLSCWRASNQLWWCSPASEVGMFLWRWWWHGHTHCATVIHQSSAGHIQPLTVRWWALACPGGAIVMRKHREQQFLVKLKIFRPLHFISRRGSESRISTSMCCLSFSDKEMTIFIHSHLSWLMNGDKWSQ